MCLADILCKWPVAASHGRQPFSFEMHSDCLPFKQQLKLRVANPYVTMPARFRITAVQMQTTNADRCHPTQSSSLHARTRNVQLPGPK